MWVPVAVWQLCELLVTCLLTYLCEKCQRGAVTDCVLADAWRGVQSWGCLGGWTVARSTASDRSSATAGRSASTYSPTRSLSAGTDNDVAESTPTAPYAHMQPAMLSICTFLHGAFYGSVSNCTEFGSYCKQGARAYNWRRSPSGGWGQGVSPLWSRLPFVFCEFAPLLILDGVIKSHSERNIPIVHTVILIIIGIPSPTHSFTLGLNPFFSANPPYRSLSFFSFRIHYMNFPDCLLLFLSISVFLLYSFFCFLTLF